MTPEQRAQNTQFNKERNEALLSMDEEKIRAMVRKWNGIEMPDDPYVFLAAVHKAITGQMDLPIELRRKSYAWLTERGLRSLDDGDLRA
jgi:hypothetical protein